MTRDNKNFGKRNNQPNKQSFTKKPARQTVKSVEDRVEEQETDRDLVAGRLPAIEVLKSERDINKIFLQEGLSGSKMEEIQNLAKKRSVQISFVPKSKLDQLVDGMNH